ncbi:unnamed protein product [Ilex paraguariensis]|uniref:Glutamine amidotransferase domain-containing protein n=1 Tax=Ilex paraguariensis TaxID=185542 RepID=A0ABC8T775_9AQUA
MAAGKRFALLLCAKDTDYVKSNYGGYYGVFVGMLADEGETWDVYRVEGGEFPDDKAIGEYNGFVISGSCGDAHGDDVWILGRALGGKTGRAISGWDIGVRTIHFSSSSSSKLFTSLKLPSPLSVIECHRDEVWEVPAKAEVIAWSDKTGVEMFRYGDHIMGIQGHPEYTKDILLHLVDLLLHRNMIMDSYADEVKARVESSEPDRGAWKKLCISFLKGGL